MSFRKWPFHPMAVVAWIAMLLAGCSTPPVYSVQEPASRAGVVESIRSQAVQTANSTAGTVLGAVAGGLLGNMVGGGTGRTVATVVGAVGGGYAGNRIAEHSQQMVWFIDVRYDDGSMATIQQTAAPGLRVGDRVLVTQDGIQLLRGGAPCRHAPGPRTRRDRMRTAGDIDASGDAPASHSFDTFLRAALTSPRLTLESTRRRCEALVGLVGRRCVGADAESATNSRRRARASSRLRSWLR